MKITRTHEPRDRESWRNWLELNHAKETEIWVVFSKKHDKSIKFTYQDALLEALCFGWIDGVRQRIDDERYAQRFSPRTKASKWSSLNKKLAGDLLAAGLMRPAGIAALDQANFKDATPEKPLSHLPPDGFLTAIQADSIAWNNFQNLPPSHQRRYVGWISDAKREDTRNKRVAEAIALLRENKRIGLGPGEVRK